MNRPIPRSITPNVYQSGNRSEIPGLANPGVVAANLQRLTAQRQLGGLASFRSSPDILYQRPPSISTVQFGNAAGYRDMAAQMTMPAQASESSALQEQSIAGEPGLRAVSLSNRTDILWFYGHHRLNSEELTELAATGRFSPSLAEHMVRFPNRFGLSARQVEALRRVARGAGEVNAGFGDRGGAGYEIYQNPSPRTDGRSLLNTSGEAATRNFLGSDGPALKLIPPTPQKFNGQGPRPRNLQGFQMSNGSQPFPPAREAIRTYVPAHSASGSEPILAWVPIGSVVDGVIIGDCRKPCTSTPSSSTNYQGGLAENGALEYSNAFDSTGRAAGSEASSSYQATNAGQATYLGYGSLNGSIHYAGGSENSTPSGPPDFEPGDPWGIRAARHSSVPASRTCNSSPVNGFMGHFALPAGGVGLFERGIVGRDQGRSASVDGSRRHISHRN